MYRFHHPTIGGNTINQLLSQLGQTVHPGSLSDVQRAYSAFQEETLGGANSLFAPVEGQSGVSLTA